MRILAFSDVHASASACQSLVERSNDSDVVVGAGDFAVMRRGLGLAMDILGRIVKPLILVPGNNESAEELHAMASHIGHARVLHGTCATVGAVTFFGVGGGIPLTAFESWSWDLSDEDARALLGRCPPGAVMVVHSPPRGLVNTPWSRGHRGSDAIREAILTHRPQAVICGHLHACPEGVEHVDGIPVYHAGPHGAMIEL